MRNSYTYRLNKNKYVCRNQRLNQHFFLIHSTFPESIFFGTLGSSFCQSLVSSYTHSYIHHENSKNVEYNIVSIMNSFRHSGSGKLRTFPEYFDSWRQNSVRVKFNSLWVYFRVVFSVSRRTL